MVIALRCQLWYFAFQTDPEDIFALFGRIIAIWCKIDHLQGLDALLIESNHDVNMLQAGPYPYYLKRRILGDHGHLSNENAGRLLNYLLHDRLKYILLGHLSKENNYEALAYETVRLEIDQGDTPYRASDFSIEVARRDEMSQILYV